MSTVLLSTQKLSISIRGVNEGAVNRRVSRAVVLELATDTWVLVMTDPVRSEEPCASGLAFLSPKFLFYRISIMVVSHSIVKIK